MGSAGQNLPAAAATGKDQAFAVKALQCGLIAIRAPALIEYLAIPGQTQTFQGVQYFVRRPPHHARGIEILDAYQPLTTGLPGQAITADGRYQGAEVKRTCGTGSKPPDNRARHVL
jgi:hypothetical protein